MPAYTDLRGRACELLVTYLLCRTQENEVAFQRVLQQIKSKYPNAYEQHLHRITVASEHAVEEIGKQVETGGERVRSARATGEERKGVNDTDILVTTDRGSTKLFSLKVYSSVEQRVNYWNPTLNSLTTWLTGKTFIQHLTAMEREDYARDMQRLRDIGVRSEDVSKRWVGKLNRIVATESADHPAEFASKLLSKLAYGKNVIRVIVSPAGEFERTLVGHPPLLDEVARNPAALTCETVGVSVRIAMGREEVTTLSVYAQSGSGGRAGGLRVAAWTPHQ